MPYLADQVELSQGSWFDFHGYWNQIKGKINELLGLGTRIRDLRLRWERVQSEARKQGDATLVEGARVGIHRSDSLFQTWLTVKNTIQRFLPQWTKGEHEGRGLSLLPVIAVAAVVAAGFVATAGLKLLKDYHQEKELLDRVEKGVLPASVAERVLTREGGIFGTLFGGAGALLPLVLVGVLAFTFMGRRA